MATLSLRRRTSNRSLRRRESLQGYLLLVPAFLLITLIIGYPLVNATTMSLMDFKLNRGIDSAQFCGLCNFQTLLEDPYLGIYLRNQLIWVSSVAVAPLVVGLALALLMNREGIMFRGLWRALLLIPWMMPIAATVFSWRWLLDQEWGLLNYYLTNLGLIEQNIGFLTDKALVWPTVLIIAIWMWYPYNYLMILASLQSIPGELYEAARIDGAGDLACLRYITLPSLRPIMTVLLLLGTIWAMNDFTTIALLTGGGPGIDTTTLAPLVHKVSFRYFDIGQGAAVGMLLMLFSLTFALIYIFRLRLNEALN